MTRTGATAIGFSAILMWSFLALFTAASGAVPPFQLAALCFTLAAGLGFAWIARTGAWADLRQPVSVWALGVGGLFGYHGLYFIALRNAPPVEAGLIAYLWPLLIVLFSALLPGERLRWFHIAGGLAGLAGTLVIVSGALEGGPGSMGGNHGLGYLAALGCALTWSTYSVLSRRFASAPSVIVAGYCLAAAVLSLIAHELFETTHWPQTSGQWLAVAGLGLMPVGGAFYVWDMGMKRGDIQLLGVLAYLAPLLSTLILVVFGFGEPTWRIALAAILITGGAVLAARDFLTGSGRAATSREGPSQIR